MLSAYLATRDHGATTERTELAFDVSVTTIYSRLPTARAWLRTNPMTGQPCLPESTKSAASKARGIGVYELEGVICDADLFKRLDQVRAAVAAGVVEAPDVVRTVYADVDERLWPAAELSVQAQLEYLHTDTPLLTRRFATSAARQWASLYH